MRDARVAQAKLLAANARWTDTLRLLAAHLADAPDDAEALCLVAQCRLGMDDPRGAADAAQAARRADPESEWAHRLCSVAMAKLGAYSPARTAADEAIRLAPWSWQAHMQRADVDAEAKSVNASTWNAARRAVEIAPNEAGAHITLGRVALAARQNSIAAAQFRKALELEPDNPVARNNLAVVELRRRRFSAAGSHLMGALRLNPNSGLYAKNLRVVLRAWGLLLNLLGVVGCVVSLNLTADLTVSTPPVELPSIVSVGSAAPEVVSLAPGVSLTVPAGVTFTVPPGQVVSGSRSVPVTGHPAVITVAAAVLLGALLLVVLRVRLSVGRTAGRIFLMSVKRDAALLLTAISCVVGVAGLCLAAAVAMPAARGILVGTLVADIAATIALRVMGRRERGTGRLAQQRG